MKKILTMLVALLAVLTMLFGTSAVSLADEAASEPVTAWLLYFANPGWWPQHQRMDQPSSETGVEATNAHITGPGNYTVGLKFNWQTAENAMQFNLVLDNAAKLMPGLYVDITEIRVNGTPIEMTADNMYGVFHDDTESGFAPIYNTYWDATLPEGAGSTGPAPETMSAFDGVLDTEHYQIIDPAQIKAGTTIEVDFVVAKEAGKLPEDIGPAPVTYTEIGEAPEAPALPDNVTTAKMYYQDGDWWPELNGTLGDSTAATLTGEGHYTVQGYFLDQGGWKPSGDNGLQKLLLIVDSPAGSTVDGMYLGISDLRVNGNSVGLGSVAYGPTGYGSGTPFGPEDNYAVLYDQWMIDDKGPDVLPWGHETWDGSSATTDAANPDDFKGSVWNIEIDFFMTATQGVVPEKPTGPSYTWFAKNTVGVAGLSLSDLGIADDWHNIVPVDLTKTAYYTYTLVGADAHVIGTAVVAVNNGNVSVHFDYARGEIYEKSQCIKWFTSLDDITAEALTSIDGGLTDTDVVNVDTDLGGAKLAYLSINNKVTWRAPVTNDGQFLVRYFHSNTNWKNYRAELMALIDSLSE